MKRKNPDVSFPALIFKNLAARCERMAGSSVQMRPFKGNPNRNKESNFPYRVTSIVMHELSGCMVLGMSRTRSKPK